MYRFGSSTTLILSHENSAIKKSSDPSVIFTIYGENKGSVAGLVDGWIFMGQNQCCRESNSLQSIWKKKKNIFIWMAPIGWIGFVI